MSTTDPSEPPAVNNRTQVQGDTEVVQPITVQAGAFVENIIGKQVVQQPFSPRSVAAAPEEIAAAGERLAALPTETIPEPQDVLPPGSWMAQLRRNAQFVGREQDLLALAALLKGGETVAVSQAQSAVASGLGGIGKTQLAIEFVYRYSHFFAGVFWLSFAQPDAISVEIARLGGTAHLQLFTEAAGLSLDDQVRFVRARLGCGLPYLLIFDNCEDPDLVRAHHPGGATRVLITSRTPDWPGDLGVKRHRLGVLRREESIALLRQHRPDLSDADADALAAELGDLPLALHLAGRFLAQYAQVLTPAQYLAELRSPRLFERLPLLKQDGTLPTGHGRDVARTFMLSYKRLDPQDAEDELAQRLLARAAFLVPGESIPAALLRMTVEGYFDDFDVRLSAEAAVRRLVHLGLLEGEPGEGVRMHPLVSAYVRQLSEGTDDPQFIAEDTVLVVTQTIANASGPQTIASFLPILRGVTNAAIPRGDERAAALCLRMGRYLESLGLYAPAQSYVERGLAIYERLFGLEHVDSATSLNNLGVLRLHQGDYDQARQLLEKALTVREKLFGSQHTDVAQTLTNLATIDLAQENYALARSRFEQALAINERSLGVEDPLIATNLSNFAAIEQKLGNHESAHTLFERALTIHERLLGIEHPDTVASMINLASSLMEQGNLVAAFPLYQQALAVGERVLGPTHPWTANILSGFATFYLQQDDVSSACLFMERALTIRRQILGPSHPDTVSTEQALGIMLPEAARRQALLADMREELAPLLLAIAWVAVGEHELRPVVTDQLVSIEEQGWTIRELVERIWAGERNFDMHTMGLDERDKAFLSHVLELVGKYERGERILPSRAIATLPEAVRAAVEANDNQALDTALSALPEEDARVIIDRLVRGGIIEKPTQPPTVMDDSQEGEAT